MKLYSALYFLSSGLLERVNCAFLFCLLGFIFRFSTRQAWLQSHALGCLSLLSVTTPEGCFAAQQCHPSQLSASRQQHRFHMGTHREAPEAQDNRSASSSEGLNFLVTSPPPSPEERCSRSSWSTSYQFISARRGTALLARSPYQSLNIWCWKASHFFPCSANDQSHSLLPHLN